MPSIDATRPRARFDQPDPPPAPPQRSAPIANDHAVDANVVAAALNDRVLYLGMNQASVPAESKSLGANVTVIAGSSSHDVTLGGVTYDISTTSGVRGFVQKLAAQNGFTLRQCEQVEGILLGSPEVGRDEIAKIAAAWAPAERGASIASRVVLSGHSSVGMLWGDNDVGTIYFQAIRDLGRALPKAGAQIEDVHISGCYSEREVQNVEEWTQSFKNLKTLWAYGAFSPRAPTSDLAAWQLATIGRATRLSEGLVASHGSATAWSINGGIAHATASLAERQQLVQEADTHFDAYLSGRAPIHSSHDSAADRDYGAYQMLASHHDTPPSERATATERGAQMLRLRYWESSVRAEIATRYGVAINRALTKAGLEPVDFNRLSREEALRVIDRYRDVKGELGPIMDGIVRLSPSVIPASFCH